MPLPQPPLIPVFVLSCFVQHITKQELRVIRCLAFTALSIISKVSFYFFNLVSFSRRRLEIREYSFFKELGKPCAIGFQNNLGQKKIYVCLGLHQPKKIGSVVRDFFFWESQSAKIIVISYLWLYLVAFHMYFCTKMILCVTLTCFA